MGVNNSRNQTPASSYTLSIVYRTNSTNRSLQSLVDELPCNFPNFDLNTIEFSDFT